MISSFGPRVRHSAIGRFRITARPVRHPEMRFSGGTRSERFSRPSSPHPALSADRNQFHDQLVRFLGFLGHGRPGYWLLPAKSCLHLLFHRLQMFAGGGREPGASGALRSDPNSEERSPTRSADISLGLIRRRRIIQKKAAGLSDTSMLLIPGMSHSQCVSFRGKYVNSTASFAIPRRCSNRYHRY